MIHHKSGKLETAPKRTHTHTNTKSVQREGSTDKLQNGMKHMYGLSCREGKWQRDSEW